MLSNVGEEEAGHSDHKDHDDAFSPHTDHLEVYRSRQSGAGEEGSALENGLSPALPHEAFHSDPLVEEVGSAQTDSRSMDL